MNRHRLKAVSWHVEVRIWLTSERDRLSPFDWKSLPCTSAQNEFNKSTYEFINLRALTFSLVNKIRIFQCVCKIFCWNFTSTLWKSTQNIIHWMHWKICFLYNIEILIALRFKSSYPFLKRPSSKHIHTRRRQLVPFDSKFSMSESI